MMRISTARRLACLCALLTLAGCTVLAPAPQEIRINQLQFIGSHNSYKQAMSAEHMAALQARNPAAAAALDYAHPPLEQQLDLGLRVLEIDVFFDPQAAELPIKCFSNTAASVKSRNWFVGQGSYLSVTGRR